VELLDALVTSRFFVPVDTTFPLAHAAEAHRYLEQRTSKGKVMLTVEP
jgi:NADPH:quinone reductase-like Zn-dependent oxidoreductase